jgi:hypothetical protein
MEAAPGEPLRIGPAQVIVRVSEPDFHLLEALPRPASRARMMACARSAERYVLAAYYQSECLLQGSTMSLVYPVASRVTGFRG